MNGMTSRRAVIAGTAAAVAGAGVGVAAGKMTEADADTSTVTGPFTVVDRRGKQRFLLATRKPPIILGGKTYPAETRGGADDGTALIFNDDGTGLTLCDPQGRPRIQLRVAMDGTPSIAILDEKGTVVKQL